MELGPREPRAGLAVGSESVVWSAECCALRLGQRSRTERLFILSESKAWNKMKWLTVNQLTTSNQSDFVSNRNQWLLAFQVTRSMDHVTQQPRRARLTVSARPPEPRLPAAALDPRASQRARPDFARKRVCACDLPRHPQHQQASPLALTRAANASPVLLSVESMDAPWMPLACR